MIADQKTKYRGYDTHTHIHALANMSQVTAHLYILTSFIYLYFIFTVFSRFERDTANLF